MSTFIVLTAGTDLTVDGKEQLDDLSDFLPNYIPKITR
jgi:hypothetical protein